VQLFPAEPSGGVLIWRGTAYTLTQVEYQILRAIADTAPVSSIDIGATVFPNSAADARQRMVSSYVARLRRKVGGPIVEATRTGYKFGSEIQPQESGVLRPLWLRKRKGA